MIAKNFRLVSFALLIFLFPAKDFSQTGDEKFLFDAVNNDRARENLPPLKWDANLAAAARAHAQLMAEHDRISHQFSGESDLTKRARAAGAHFSEIAENVAESYSVSQLHIAWMTSTPHRANILNPRLTAIGIAIEKRGEQYFGVQDFSTAVVSFTKDEQEKKVGALLQAHGLRIEKNPDEARKACNSTVSIPGVHALAIMHFEAPDLNQLPDGIVSAIKKGNYRTAAVGACYADESTGFSRFRISLLLY